MKREVTICDSCAHLDRTTNFGPYDPQATARCNAFPQGIPADIWFLGQDHRDPIADEVFTYEMEPGREDTLRGWLERITSGDSEL